jgi:hypothetical protein
LYAKVDRVVSFIISGIRIENIINKYICIGIYDQVVSLMLLPIYTDILIVVVVLVVVVVYTL